MTDYALALDEVELQRYRMMAANAQQVESELWTRAGIGPGARVADVGCGPGAVSAVLAEMVGPSGAVAAVDADEVAVENARAALSATGLQNWSASVGSADATGLTAGGFDVVMIRHVLAHNGGREQAIVEHAASLLRPGGVLYLVDVDLTTTKMHPSEPDFDDLFSRYVDYHRAKGNNPEIGLELRWLLEGAGLHVLDHRGRIDIIPAMPGMRPPPWAAREAMLAAGIVTEADIERWARALERFDAAQRRPLIFPTIFVALGRRG
jgi:precorrin-6B methylase 2